VKEWITYEEFMQLFMIKTNDYSLLDVKNALRLLAGDDDTYIPIEKFKKILQTQGQSEEKIRDTVKLLAGFIDANQRFNYKEFLKSLA
jgi:Ca2+-binding EF-hand superfamily protein